MTLHAKMSNLAVLVFVLWIFILRGVPPPSDSPEGGGQFFFWKRKRGSISLYMPKRTNLTILVFFTSYSSVSWWGPPPWDAPGAKSYIRTRGSDIAKMKEGDLRNPKIYIFFITINFVLGRKYDSKQLGLNDVVPLSPSFII